MKQKLRFGENGKMEAKLILKTKPISSQDQKSNTQATSAKPTTWPLFAGTRTSGAQRPQPRLRSCCGLLSLFLLEVAADDDETQSKQAKDKRVFLRLGNHAVHPNAQTLISLICSPTAKDCTRRGRPVAVVGAGRGNVKVANRLVHHPVASPADGHPAGAVVEVAAASNTADLCRPNPSC